MTEQIKQQTTQKKAQDLQANDSKKNSNKRKHRNRASLSSNNHQPQKPFRPKKKKVEFDPSRFHWCYGKGDIPEDMELIATSEKRFVRSGSTIDQAKGTLRSDIREIGGNATMNLSIERGDTEPVTVGWGYKAAKYCASSNPALVLPKQMPQKEKEERLSKFLLLSEGIVENPAEENSNQGFELFLLLCLPFALLLLFCIFR